MHRRQKLGRAPGQHDGQCCQDERDKSPLVGVCGVAVHDPYPLGMRGLAKRSFWPIAGALRLGDG